MTITEFLAMPNSMCIEEYEYLIKKKHKLEKQIAKASNDILDAEDSLEVLRDEVGSDRYNKHLSKKEKAKIKRDKANRELEQLNKMLC
jgi:hypothetical protein